MRSLGVTQKWCGKIQKHVLNWPNQILDIQEAWPKCDGKDGHAGAVRRGRGRQSHVDYVRISDGRSVRVLKQEKKQKDPAGI